MRIFCLFLWTFNFVNYFFLNNQLVEDIANKIQMKILFAINGNIE